MYDWYIPGSSTPHEESTQKIIDCDISYKLRGLWINVLFEDDDVKQQQEEEVIHFKSFMLFLPQLIIDEWTI